MGGGARSVDRCGFVMAAAYFRELTMSDRIVELVLIRLPERELVPLTAVPEAQPVPTPLRRRRFRAI
jgi:hypothetical protein